MFLELGMPETELTIVKVNPPERCEICHQADQFDPESGVCHRCSHLPQLSHLSDQGQPRANLTAILAAILGVAACIVWSISISRFGTDVIALKLIIPSFFCGVAGMVAGREGLKATKGEPPRGLNKTLAKCGFWSGVIASTLCVLQSILIDLGRNC